ncbi:MAG: helix-turn-helix domain-containing protein [Verrucomicrobiota bacterium]
MRPRALALSSMPAGISFLHGFRTVTMDDLAAELGVSKKTLYAHFPSKDALVEAVIRAKFNDLDTDLRRITSGEDRSLPGALQRLLEASQAHLGEIQPSFVRDLRRESPRFFG